MLLLPGLEKGEWPEIALPPLILCPSQVMTCAVETSGLELCPAYSNTIPLLPGQEPVPWKEWLGFIPASFNFMLFLPGLEKEEWPGIMACLL